MFKLIADDRTHEYFSATPDGLRKLGRFMAHKWPDRNVSCSSSLDYPWEYGVDIDPDDIVKYITEGVTEIQP